MLGIMTSLRMQLVAAATALSLSTAGCAYVIHPEQRGNTGGSLDGLPLVVDILLLLPGLLPGIVALVVDFSSGAIYTGGGGGHGAVIVVH